MTVSPSKVALHTRLFAGDGEMSGRCRGFDWAATPVGAMEQWPQTLVTAAQSTMPSVFPTIILWGPTLIQIYNDAYRDFMGAKHPAGLGCPTRECWPELWEINAPMYARIFNGEALTFESDVFSSAQNSLASDSPFSLVYSPIRDESGVAGILVTLGAPPGAGAGSGVTELVSARREIERLVAERARLMTEIGSANRAKSDFLGTMSHELRTPLNAIGGFAQLIDEGVFGPVAPAQHAALGRIQRGQRHLLGLVNEVLNYVKLETGTVHYHSTDVPLGEVLMTVEALTAWRMRAKGLVVVFEGCDERLTAHADREKLEQIVLNLISNAIKFTDAGGCVTIGCAQAGHGCVLMRVVDTGVGIAGNQLERVFQPFVQIDVSLVRVNEGTGLGLAISRELAHGMGGTLTVESAPGEGSTFTLTLPAAIVADDFTPVSATRQGPRESSGRVTLR